MDNKIRPDIFACNVPGCGYRGTTSSGLAKHKKKQSKEQRHAFHAIREKRKTKQGPVRSTVPMPKARDRRFLLLDPSETLRTCSVRPTVCVTPVDETPTVCGAVVYPTEEPYPFVVREYEVGAPIECSIRGCDFWCLTLKAFLAHKHFHAEQFADAEEGGDRDPADKSTQRTKLHMIHRSTGNADLLAPNAFEEKKCKTSPWSFGTKEYPFVCGVPECRRRFKTSSRLLLHRIDHTFTQSHRTCEFPGCLHLCLSPKELVSHRKTHVSWKPYKCDFPACGYQGATPSALTVHMKRHSKEGQIRQRKQENRLMKRLKEWGYTVDVEVIINAKRGECVQDTDHRYFSRLDFVIVECVSHILIVECDENQHSSYLLPCELSRMSDVQAALVLAGYSLPVHWIRYSPNGKYVVGGRQRFPIREDREVLLKAYIDSVCRGGIRPSGQMSLHFMFYNRFVDGGPPCIVTRPEFPEHLREFVTWV